MTLMALPARAKRGSLALAGTAIAVCGVLAATPGPLLAQHHAARVAPRPPFALFRDSVVAHDSTFQAYVVGLRFLTDDRDVDRRVLLTRSHGSGDTTLFIGQKAELAPCATATLMRGSWARGGQVMARITLRGDSAYPTLGLRPGINYLIIRSGPAHGSDSLWAYMKNGSWISRDFPIFERPHQGPARFILSPNDDDFCTPCDSRYCCTAQ